MLPERYKTKCKLLLPKSISVKCHYLSFQCAKSCFLISSSFVATITCFSLLLATGTSVNSATSNYVKYKTSRWNAAPSPYAPFPGFGAAQFQHGPFLYAPIMPAYSGAHLSAYKNRPPRVGQFSRPKRQNRSKATGPRKKIVVDSRNGLRMVNKLKSRIAEAQQRISEAYEILSSLTKTLKRLTFVAPECGKCNNKSNEDNEESEGGRKVSLESIESASEQPQVVARSNTDVDSDLSDEDVRESQMPMKNEVNSGRTSEILSTDEPDDEVQPTRLVLEDFSDDEGEEVNDGSKTNTSALGKASDQSSDPFQARANKDNLGQMSRQDEKSAKGLMSPPERVKDSERIENDRTSESFTKSGVNEDPKMGRPFAGTPNQGGERWRKLADISSGEVERQTNIKPSSPTSGSEAQIMTQPSTSNNNVDESFVVTNKPPIDRGGEDGNLIKPPTSTPFVFRAQREPANKIMDDVRSSTNQPLAHRHKSRSESSYAFSSSDGKGNNKSGGFMQRSLNKMKNRFNQVPIFYGALEKAKTHVGPQIESAMEQARDAFSLFQSPSSSPFGKPQASSSSSSAGSGVKPLRPLCPTCRGAGFMSAPPPSKLGGAHAAAIAASNKMFKRAPFQMPPMPAMVPPMVPMLPKQAFSAFPAGRTKSYSNLGAGHKRQRLGGGDEDDLDANLDVYEHDTGPIVKVSDDGTTRTEERHQAKGSISRDGSSFNQSGSSYSSRKKSSSSSFSSSSSSSSSFSSKSPF